MERREPIVRTPGERAGPRLAQRPDPLGEPLGRLRHAGRERLACGVPHPQRLQALTVQQRASAERHLRRALGAPRAPAPRGPPIRGNDAPMLAGHRPFLPAPSASRRASSHGHPGTTQRRRFVGSEQFLQASHPGPSRIGNQCTPRPLSTRRHSRPSSSSHPRGSPDRSGNADQRTPCGKIRSRLQNLTRPPFRRDAPGLDATGGRPALLAAGSRHARRTNAPGATAR